MDWAFKGSTQRQPQPPQPDYYMELVTLKEDNDIFDLSFQITDNSKYKRNSKKLSRDEKINKRFDDVVSRIDASQRAEASMHQILSIVLNDLKDLKHQLRHSK